MLTSTARVFKYQAEIDKFTCDLSDFTEREARTSYRWTFDPIEDPRNFLPVYLRQEDRPRDTCLGWSLSMYETQQQAEARLKFITKDKDKAYKKLGTHTAAGILCAADGKSDTASIKSENFGHFEHFEYEGCNLTPKFHIVSQVAP